MFGAPSLVLQRALAALALVCAATSSVRAAPGDEMGQFLTDRGLVEQIKNAGAQVRDRASNLVGHAMMFLGVPYKRGGNSAETGFDCSGFVRAVYEQSLGMLLPRKASDQAAATVPIDKAELQPGDLVFFNTLKAAFSHVGIYVGDGKFVHSPRTGAQVRVEDMRMSYWETRFNGARRVSTELRASAPSDQAKPVVQPALAWGEPYTAVGVSPAAAAAPADPGFAFPADLTGTR